MTKTTGVSHNPSCGDDASSEPTQTVVRDQVPPVSGTPSAVFPHGRPPRFAWTSRGLVLLSASIVVLIFGVAGLLIMMQRGTALADSQRTTANLAQALAEQTFLTMQPVDMALREVAKRLADAVAESPGKAGWDAKATFEMLTERLKGLPQVDALAVIGADGHLVNFSRAFPPPAMDVTSRDYYRYFSEQDDHGLFVGAPARAYLSGKWTVFLVRRINDKHGTFAGVAVAIVTLSYLEDFYRAVTPENGAVVVLRRDGMILVRYPPKEQVIGAFVPVESPWYKVSAAGGGSYRSVGYLSNEPSLISVRLLPDFPLVMDVGIIQAAALAAWRQQTAWLVVGAAVVSACAIFLLRVFSMQYNRLSGQNAELESRRQQFDAVLANMSQGLTLFDRDRRMLVCNRRFVEMYRLSPEQTRPGTPLSQIIEHRIAVGTFLDMAPTAYEARAQNLVDAADDFELINELSDGRAILLHSRPMGNGGWVSTHEDITERRRTEAALAFLAQHDALTGLPNRALFQERLEQAIAMVQRGGHSALLCLDLDRFKIINDTLGHPVGDGLLRAVAGRLSAIVRQSDTVARLGGDEFAVILMGLRDPEQAAQLAERIIATLSDHYEIDGHRITVGTSIGVATAPRDGSLPDTLLKNADIALYLAKTEGRGTYRFFEPEIDLHLQKRRVVEMDLRNARPTEDFELHYQPILDIESESLIGFEALIRWNHPTRGLVGPAEFIPIAEETGLIVSIGEWVLWAACREAASWPDQITLAVNLSPVQFKRGHLLDVVHGALSASGLAPHRLELEITESVLLENSSTRLALLHQLRASGIRIALDDFGTGYSSLSYLRSFPFNKIKIDRSFIREVDTNRESAAIVGAIVGLANSLGMTTVAEGVETAQQLAAVRDQGCAMVQGYLFARPCRACEVPELIRRLLLVQKPKSGDDNSGVGHAGWDPSLLGSTGQANRGADLHVDASVAIPS